MAEPSFIAELQRRRVFRVLVGYGVVSFAVLQIVEPIMHALHLPDSVLTYCVIALGAGFPIAVVLAWAFDVNAGAIERTPAPSGTGLRGVRLAVLLVGIGALGAAPGLVWYLLRARPAANGAQSNSGAAQEDPSIAVLPFSDLSEKHDQEYFADGVAEEILNLLAHVRGLKVIGRPSSFSFKGKSDDLKSIGQRLEVKNLLEGSLRKEGDQIRITTQLIRVADGSHLWSETYDRKLDGIFKLQDEIARTVVGALEGKLLGEAQTAPPGAQTTSPEVYELFLQGREQLRIVRPAAGRRAIEMLEKAVALDPSFAPAWAQLAVAHLHLFDWYGDPQKGLLVKSRAEAERAVALAPELAQAHAVRAQLWLFLYLNFALALADVDRALAISPNDPDSLSFKAELVYARGKSSLAEALSYLRRATELDPLNIGAWSRRGLAETWSGDFAAAETSLARALAIAPANSSGTYYTTLLRILQGKPAAALELARRSEIGWIRLTGTAMAEHDLGHERESRAALDEMISNDNPESTAAYQIAQVCARRGERDGALHWLERAYALRDKGIPNLKVDLFFTGFHDEPRFKALLAKMSLPLD